MREVGRVRRRDVLLADRLAPRREGASRSRRAGRLHAGRVGLAPAPRPAARSPRAGTCSRSAARAARRRRARPGQLDRVLDARRRSRHRLDVGARTAPSVNTCSSKAGELHLAEDAARLDVVQHAAERADVAGQLLHLADAAMHLLEPLGDLAEALAEALLERRVQLLVDGGADLLELLLVVGLDRAEPRLDRRLAPRPCAGRWRAPAPRSWSRERRRRAPSATPPGAALRVERRVERLARQARLLDLRQRRLARATRRAAAASPRAGG